MRKREAALKEYVCIVILLVIFGAVLVSVFSVPVLTAAASAVVVFIGGMLRLLSRNSVKKAGQILCADGGGISKRLAAEILLGILSPFFFCEFMLALLAVPGIAVWIFFFFPAVVLFSFCFGFLTDFLDKVGISQKLFWGIQLLMQFTAFSAGRAFGMLLVRR